MSRQGVVQQMPPLFLSQRQHQQLERNFTEPYRRQIAELQNQVEFWQTTSEQQQEEIAGLQDQLGGLEANQWPEEREVIQERRYFTTNVILWFSWNGGTANPVQIVSYHNNHTNQDEFLTVPAGTESALVKWDYTTGKITFFADGDIASGYKYSNGVTVQYGTNNNRIMAFY